MILSSSPFMAVHGWHRFWFSDTLLCFYKCSENHPLVFRVSVWYRCLLVSDFLQSSCAVCLAAQLCPILCDPRDCSPSGSSVHGDSPGKNMGVGCHALLQGIFPTQGLNPGLPHCRWILYCLSQFICLDLPLRQRVLFVAYFYIFLWAEFLTHNFFHMTPWI